MINTTCCVCPGNEQRADYPKGHIRRNKQKKIWVKVKKKFNYSSFFSDLFLLISISLHGTKEKAISNSDFYGMATAELDKQQLIYYFRSCFIISNAAIDRTYHA